MALAPRPASIPFLLLLFDPNFQPRLDPTQHLPIDDTPGDRSPPFPVRKGVQVFRPIGVDPVGIPRTEKFMHLTDGVVGLTLRSVTVSARFPICLEDGFQHQLGGGLCDPVSNRRHTERPLTAPRLRNHPPSHGLGFITPGAKFVSEFRQPLLPPPSQLHPLEGLTFDAGCAFLGFRQVVPTSQNILAADLVVEPIEAVVRFVFRLALQLP